MRTLRLLLVGALSLTAAAASAAPEQVRLAWQGATDSTMTVTWRAPEPKGVVEFGALDALDRRVAAESVPFEGSFLHRAQLTGLTPKTRYAYRCGAPEAWSSKAEFTTAPARGEPVGFRFVAMGDSRGADPARERVLAAAAARKPAFAIHLGDAVSDGKDQSSWDDYFRLLQPLASASPMMFVVGNHESNAPRFWQQVATPTHAPTAEGWADGAYYSFDISAAHFVVVSTEPVGAADGAQARWLEANLAAARADAGVRWIVAVGHRPPYSSGRHGNDAKVLETLVPIFEKYAVDLALFCHDHHYERFVPVLAGKPDAAGVTYFVTGGAGAPLYSIKAGPMTAFARSTHHFLDVAVGPEEMRVEARDDAGQAFDSVVLQRRHANAAKGRGREKRVSDAATAAPP